MLGLDEGHPVPEAGKGTEYRGLVAMDMQEICLSFFEYPSEPVCSAEEGKIAIGKNDDFRSLSTRLRSKFPIVKQNKNSGDTHAVKTAKHSKDMPLDTAE
jgi:hypothetical protein